MKTKTRISYTIRTKGMGGCFSPCGYSKFHKRLSMADLKKIRYSAVYGPQQCRDHIAELRRHKYEGKLIHRDATFEIVKEVRTEQVIFTSHPKKR